MKVSRPLSAFGSIASWWKREIRRFPEEVASLDRYGIVILCGVAIAIVGGFLIWPELSVLGMSISSLGMSLSVGKSTREMREANEKLRREYLREFNR